MALFRFPHTWRALTERAGALDPIVAELDDRDRTLEDHLAELPQGEAGNYVVAYTTGGALITYRKQYSTPPVPTCNLEAPAGAHPYVAYVADPTTTGFKVVIYTGGGVETVGGLFRVYWHATLNGA